MDLSTSYLGMRLKSPLVPSSSPLSESLDNIKLMEDSGASAVVMHSLFEEQLTHESRELDHYLSYFTESFPEALTWFPEAEDYIVGPEEYLERIRRAKESVDIPIIGSLNGVSTGGWIEYARDMQKAGADALELNIYYIPTDPRMTGNDVEQMYVDIIRDVKNNITIPLAVKLSPYFSAMANMAQRLADAGADGLVLFNRFYQPDLDLERLEVVPNLVLSNSTELRLPLRWVALLYGRVNVDYAITTGVHTHLDVIKSVMAGANVAMMASTLLKRGIQRLTTIRNELVFWMEKYQYESIEQMCGSMSQKHVSEPAAFERANYMKVLHSWRPDPTGQASNISRE